MYLFGYSLDNISLMALTLCVGFVVDDAIVMLENITRHIEMGKSVMQATLDGSQEIVFTIISMTISLAAVFIPVLFMGGILGRLLHEFAVTIIVAVLISGFVSLTLTPMMCSRILKPHRKDERHGRLYMAFERGVRRRGATPTTCRCAGRSRTSASCWSPSSASAWRPACCSRARRRASCRARTPGSCSASSRARRTSPSRR